MASYGNFSQKRRAIQDGAQFDGNNSLSYDPVKIEQINFEGWTEFLSYYRYYIDEFAVDILGLNLFPFQRLIMRAMGRYPNSMLIMCRGLGKSYLCAIFMLCMGILYPGMAIGIISGNGNQARMVIKQKIEGELLKNENIKREISSLKTGTDDCIVYLKNGSSIRAITLGVGQKGDNARGKNCLYSQKCGIIKVRELLGVLKGYLTTT